MWNCSDAADLAVESDEAVIQWLEEIVSKKAYYTIEISASERPQNVAGASHRRICCASLV